MKIFGIEWEQIASLLRGVLLSFGTSYVTIGVLSQSQLEIIVGGIIGLIGVLLGQVSAFNKAKSVAVVTELASSSTMVAAINQNDTVSVESARIAGGATTLVIPK